MFAARLGVEFSVRDDGTPGRPATLTRFRIEHDRPIFGTSVGRIARRPAPIDDVNRLERN